MLHACSIPGISESGMAPLSLTRGQCWPVSVGTSCVLAASLESASLQGRRARRLWSSPGRCQQCLRSCCIPRACESARAPLSPIRAQYVRCHLIPLSCRIVWMPECALVSLSPILQQSVRRQSVLRAVGHLGPRAHCGTTLANLVAACPAPVRPAFLSHCLGSVGPSLLPFWEQFFSASSGAAPSCEFQSHREDSHFCKGVALAKLGAACPAPFGQVFRPHCLAFGV